MADITPEMVERELTAVYRDWWDSYKYPAIHIAQEYNAGLCKNLDRLMQYLWVCFPGGGTAEIATNRLNNELNLGLKWRKNPT